MTEYPNKFISLRNGNRGKLTFGHNMSYKIIGKGMNFINEKIKDKNVFLVEDLKPNLLSVSQTCDQGNTCIFYFEKCEIIKRDSRRLVAVVVRN